MSSKKTGTFMPYTRVVGVIALAFSLFTTPLQAAPGIETITASPASKKLAMEMAFVDLRLAAYGDDVAIKREFVDGEWVWNKQWQAVSSQYDESLAGSGSAEDEPWYDAHQTVTRYKVTFERQGGAQFRAADVAPGEYVEISQSGFTWRDVDGNWIEYDAADPEQTDLNGGPPMAGYIHGYGNALYSNTIVRDAENRVHQLKDTFGNLLLTITYKGSTDLPVRAEDYSGRVVSYGYNAENQLTTVTDVRGQEWHYTYTDKGQPKSFEDPNGNITRYAYTNNSITVTTADGLSTVHRYQYDRAKDKFHRFEERPDGSVREHVYDNTTSTGSTPKYESYIDGELISQRFGDAREYRIVDEAGESTAYKTNRFGKVTEISYPDGTKETWEYSANGKYNLAHVDRKDTRTEWDYDSQDRVIEVRRAVGLPEQQTIRYSYSTRLTRSTMRLGDAHTGNQITTETYDEYGNLIEQTDSEQNTTQYTRNVLGQPLTVTEPGAATTTYTYDAAGNLTHQTDPLNRVTQYTYNAAGNLKTATWPNEATTTYTYNALNQQVKTVNAKNESVQMAYDRESRTFTYTDGTEASTQVRMDARGLPAVIEDPNGNQTQQTYEDGRLTSTQYPTFEQTYSYGAGARLKQVTDHYDNQQSATQLEVDPLGQIKEQVDANSNPTRRDYDAFGRVTTITDALGGVTRLTYDVHGNLVRVTDPEGRSTGFEYNGNNQMVAEERRPTASEVSRRTYRYDGRGNLATEVTPKGQKIVYSYNDANELTDIQLYPDTSTSTPAQVITLTYSALGRLTGYDDGDTAGTYTYDELGQLLTATTDYGPFAKTIQYTYDAAGNIQTYTNPEAVTYTYTYDGNGQVTSIDIPDVGLVGFSDYQWTQPRRITLPGGSVIQRQYDGLQRMASNTLLDPAQTALMQVAYGYDPVGNVKSQTTNDGEYRYDYDSLYRLTDADYPAANDETFGYDGVGNRTSHNGDDSWTYGDANQLTHQGDTDYTYDASGHLTSKTTNGVTTHYLYNAQERLVRVEDNDGAVIAEYGYNPFGHRLWKEVEGVRTYFFYNSSGLVGEYASDGSLKKEYQYLPNMPWMTNPLLQRTGGAVYFYQNDHLGTPQRLVARSGDVVWQASYRAFGETSAQSGTVTNNLRFPGQYYDTETGFYHNYFRDYAPQLGRYIQSDPIGMKGGINSYIYALQNPLTLYDCDGLIALQLINFAVGAVLSGYSASSKGGSWGDIFMAGVVGGASNALTGRATFNAIVGALGNAASQVVDPCFEEFDISKIAVAGALGKINLASRSPIPQPNLMSNVSVTGHTIASQTLNQKIIDAF